MSHVWGLALPGDPVKPLTYADERLFEWMNTDATFTSEERCCDCPTVFSEGRVRAPATDSGDYDARLFWGRGAGGGRGLRASCCRAPEPGPELTRMQRLKERLKNVT